MFPRSFRWRRAAGPRSAGSRPRTRRRSRCARRPWRGRPRGSAAHAAAETPQDAARTTVDQRQPGVRARRNSQSAIVGRRRAAAADSGCRRAGRQGARAARVSGRGGCGM